MIFPRPQFWVSRGRHGFIETGEDIIYKSELLRMSLCSDFISIIVKITKMETTCEEKRICRKKNKLRYKQDDVSCWKWRPDSWRWSSRLGLQDGPVNGVLLAEPRSRKSVSSKTSWGFCHTVPELSVLRLYLE